eukprot:gene2181-2045_t
MKKKTPTFSLKKLGTQKIQSQSFQQVNSPLHDSIMNSFIKEDIQKYLESYNKFKAIDGKVSFELDFVKTIGIFGLTETFSKFFFEILSSHKSQTFDFYDFISTCSILINGEKDQRMKLIFNSISDNNGFLIVSKFIKILNSLFEILSELSLIEDRVTVQEEFFLNFQKIFPDESKKIDFEEYKTILQNNTDFFTYFGMNSKIKKNETNENEKNETDENEEKNINDEDDDTDVSELEFRNFRAQSKNGDVVVIGSSNWNFSINIMLGIQLSNDMINLVKRELKQNDFTLTTTFELPLINEDISSTTFTSHAPTVFKKIRSIFQISDNDLFKSIGINQLFGNFLFGRLTSFSNKSSDGKSGSHFFISNDSKFLIKTISKNEISCLKKILPFYYQHFRENFESLIVRIYGWYEIDDVHFIIMGGIFQTNIDVVEFYDLKGSTVGRTSKGAFPKKDLDIEPKRFKFPIDEKLKLEKQLLIDTEFLKTMKIIDYSLLIGVHEVDSFSSVVALTNCTTLKNTSVIITKSEIYFLGIIDILTIYDGVKSTEHNLKSILHDGNKISSVPPTRYQERFLGFLETCME